MKKKNIKREVGKGMPHPANPNDKFMKSKKKKMTQAQDDAYDRKNGIKEGSKADIAEDRKHGIMDKKKQKTQKQVIAHKTSSKKKNWIQGAIKNPGALHQELGVKQGNKIPAGKLNAAAKKPGAEGRRARLAQTLKGLNHKSKTKREEYMKRVGKGKK